MLSTFRHMLRHICLVLAWTASASWGFAQSETQSYFFDGEDVVFVFDIRNYAKALLGENALKVDFADLGIYDVAITGQFTHWSKKGWTMKKRDEFTFELRKHIQDFKDAFPMDFRYIINGRYIADPQGQITDPRQFGDDFLEDVFKLDLSVIKIKPDGENVFFLPGFRGARKVILAGSFNGWNEQTVEMTPTSQGWEIRGDLPPGRYEYKFIVDGVWMHDPANSDYVMNEHGTLNSVLRITVPITFTLKGHTEARAIVLAGSFNDWNEKDLKLTRVDNGWSITIPLHGGKHTYKFIVDGQWITDPANPVLENDGYGNLNSVKFVH